MSTEIPMDDYFREADAIKVEDGVEYESVDLQRQEWLERKMDSPSTLFDENVDWTYWQGLAGYLKPIVRRTQDPNLYDARSICLAYAKSLWKHRINRLTPFQSQKELFDRLFLAIPDEAEMFKPLMNAAMARIDNVMRCWRESNYIYFSKRFLGRNVG